MQTFWMDTHWMDPYWWDTCWRYVLVGYVLVGYVCNGYVLVGYVWNGYVCNGYVLVGYVWNGYVWNGYVWDMYDVLDMYGILVVIGGRRITTFWMDTHCMDTYWWDTYGWDTFGMDMCGICAMCWICVGYVWWIRLQWICVGYVWCAGYVWDMCGICVVWDTQTIFWRTLRRNVFREKKKHENHTHETLSFAQLKSKKVPTAETGHNWFKPSNGGLHTWFGDLRGELVLPVEHENNTSSGPWIRPAI